jgi:hypothetical protein
MLPEESFSPIFSHIQKNSSKKLVVEMALPICKNIRKEKMALCFKDLPRLNRRNRDICLRRANEEAKKCFERKASTK